MFEVRNYKVLNNKALNFFVKYNKLKLLQYISLNFDVGKDFVDTKVANVTAGTFFACQTPYIKLISFKSADAIYERSTY